MTRDLGRLLTAMVTPFRADGSLDYESASRLARILVADGSDGVVVCGTTGESPTLTDPEKLELTRRVKAAIPEQTVITGTGGNDTRHSIELSKAAIDAGADGLLCVVPYYNKPTQEGIFRHFAAIANAVAAPIVMYNIPGRTGVNMSAETALRCAEIPNIAGVKEASANIDQMGLICAGRPAAFRVWSGDDGFTLPLLAIGGHGVICVVSHLAGGAMRAMIEAHLGGEPATAGALHGHLLPLITALMTVASNPIPVKSALNRLGFPAGPFRLPLTEMAAPEMARTMAAVAAAGDLVTFPKMAVHVS
ncbi:MAG: 4-hydroxy-tetrahydrodipicolinate synthase [Candidatus Dormibacteraceae bacterium]